MKIAQVCPGYPPALGGVEQHVRHISERLAREHQVTVFATDASGKLPVEEQINDVLVRRFRSFSPGNAYHISFQMLRELRKSEFDIVHGHSYHAFPLFFSKYANKRKKFIVTPHYLGHASAMTRRFLLGLYKPFGKKIFQEADKVVAVSNYEREMLIRDFKIDGDKVTVIPNGVDLKEFGMLEKKEKQHKTILCAGRLEKYKGVQHAIQVLPLLEPSIGLEVVGEGAYKQKLIRLAQNLGVQSRVQFYHGLDRRQLLDRYANADLFMLLSKYEAFSIAIVEALAAKTPCIVANTSGLKQCVDNENCFGIDYPISSDHLAELINKVISKKVGEVKLWDWEEVVEETVKVYKEGL